ncbi:MAG: hypothetical protein ACRENU_05975 [Gemmatimonadaceae bacterium]
MRYVDEGREQRLRQGILDAERASERLQVQVDQLIASNRDLSGLLLAAERRRGELMKLIVAFKRLVDATDSASAILAVEEIVVAVIGSENFVVLATDGSATLAPIAGMGRAFDHGRSARPRPDQLVAGPSGRTAQALAAQWLGSSDVAACVPMRIMDHVVGAIVIASLLPHREPLGLQDEQVLCVLGGFAATSIIAAAERRHWTQLIVASDR